MNCESSIKSKEKLLEQIKINKEDLSFYLQDYLKCLLDLEFSVTKPYINERERLALEFRDIYIEVMAFNLYYRTKAIFETNNYPVGIYGNSQSFSVYTDLTRKMTKVFEFYHGTNHSYHLNYNHLSIYEYIQTLKTKNEILVYLSELIERIRNEKNPYPNRIMKYTSSLWESNHKQIIESYELGYQEVVNRSPTIEDFALAALTQEIKEEFYKEYDLKDDDFEEATPRTLTDDFHINTGMVKRLKDIEIRRDINYF